MKLPPPEITDDTGRQFKTLRVSLTGSCNLSCAYCTSDKRINVRNDFQDYRRLTEMILVLHQRLQFHTIRFTGGEPLLYPHIIPLIEVVRKATKNVSFKMTTNGYLLSRKATALSAAGLKSINVSLDAMNEDTFYKIARKHGVDKVLNGIDAAQTAGMEVKINSVIMRGVNEQEIVPLLVYGYRHQIPVRYLEVMKMGHLFHNFRDHFFSMREIIKTIRDTGLPFTAIGKERNGTACYWQLFNGYSFGIIANETVPFCHDCNRLRLDSDGNIYGCLSSNRPLNIISSLNNNEELSGLLLRALSHKKEVFTGSKLSMMDIGG